MAAQRERNTTYMRIQRITLERLERLREQLDDDDITPGEVLGTPSFFPPNRRCGGCNQKMTVSYMVESETMCEDCTLLALLRGLVSMIYDIKGQGQGTEARTAFGKSPIAEILPQLRASLALKDAAPEGGLPNFVLDPFTPFTDALKAADHPQNAPISHPTFSEILAGVPEHCTLSGIEIPEEGDNVVLPIPGDYSDEMVAEERVRLRLGMRMPGDPPPPEPPVDPRPRFAAKASDFSRTGAGVIHMTSETKINVMDLPPGTILKFAPVKPIPVDRTPVGPKHNMAEVSPWDRDLVRVEGDPEVGPANARKYTGHEIVRPEFDLTTLSPEEQELFAGYTPGVTRFESLEDVQNYEKTVGDPEIMAALDAQEDEFIEEQRREFGDDYVEAMLKGGQNKIVRRGGVGHVRTAGSKPSSSAGPASPSTQSTFPSLARPVLRS